MYEYAENVKQKKDLMKEDVESAQMKECTFSPQVIRLNDQPRTLDEFLQDQNKFQQKKHDNIEKISGDNKEKVAGSVTLKPQIDENSAVLIQRKPRNAPIYERLFEMSKKPVGKPEEDSKEESHKQRTSQERRDLKLYNIAVQKKKDQEEKEQEEKRKRRVKPTPVASNDPLVILGFRKEFHSAVESCGAAESSKTNYVQTSMLQFIIW